MFASIGSPFMAPFQQSCGEPGREVQSCFRPPQLPTIHTTWRDVAVYFHLASMACFDSMFPAQSTGLLHFNVDLLLLAEVNTGFVGLWSICMDNWRLALLEVVSEFSIFCRVNNKHKAQQVYVLSFSICLHGLWSDWVTFVGSPMGVGLDNAVDKWAYLQF